MADGKLWVARITRHALLHRQLLELKALFGDDVGIVPFDVLHGPNLDREVEAFDYMLSARHYVAVEVIMPPRLVAKILQSRTVQSGTILMRPIMTRIPGKTGCDIDQYRFSHYERILEMYERTERLVPPFRPADDTAQSD